MWRFTPGARRACDHLSNRELPPNLFDSNPLKSSVRSRIRLRSADARLGRPWPELGGMANQAAPGHRGRAAQFRARLGRRARFLIAVHCCARWLHARRRAHSVCKQTLREPRMSRPARALISALSRTPRASLGTLSSRPKTGTAKGRLRELALKRVLPSQLNARDDAQDQPLSGAIVVETCLAPLAKFQQA